MGAVAGPVLGPVVGGFAAAANGWRWPIWELAWISGFSSVFLLFFLPETLGDTILLKRARRLRELTGNENLRSLSEIKQSEMTTKAIAWESLVRPFQLMIEPAVFFINLYVGCKCAEPCPGFQTVLLTGGVANSCLRHLLPMVRSFPTRFRRYLPLQGWRPRSSIHRYHRRGPHLICLLRLLPPPLPLPQICSTQLASRA